MPRRQSHRCRESGRCFFERLKPFVVIFIVDATAQTGSLHHEHVTAIRRRSAQASTSSRCRLGLDTSADAKDFVEWSSDTGCCDRLGWCVEAAGYSGSAVRCWDFERDPLGDGVAEAREMNANRTRAAGCPKRFFEYRSGRSADRWLKSRSLSAITTILVYC